MAQVMDPVCGKLIERDAAAARSEYEGLTYFFCSVECAHEFERNPAEMLERH